MLFYFLDSVQLATHARWPSCLRYWLGQLFLKIQRTLSHLQNLACRDWKPIGDYKQELESFVDTTSRIEGSFTFVTVLMEPILKNNGGTLVAYLGMDAAA